MSRPQQPEVYRSGTTPALEPDSIASELEAHPRAERDGHEGAVPPDNRPGHHPEHEQDRPDLDAVAQALGTVPPEARPSSGSAPGLLDRVPRLARNVGFVAVGLAVLAVREVTRRLARD